ncbi:MAG: hypothetical protein LBJ61_01550, partial [Deltaproteobacteria bacterium]|nr:hypothetical protein [Deltaproteobacteria bacterium]
MSDEKNGDRKFEPKVGPAKPDDGRSPFLADLDRIAEEDTATGPGLSPDPGQESDSGPGLDFEGLSAKA